MADFISWLSHYSAHGVFLATALLSLLESLAFVGMLVPGVAVLASLSWIAGQQALSLPFLLLCAFSGAVIGDGISFALGHYSAPWIAKRHTLQDHPRWLLQGQAFFRRYGGSSILLGRFIGPVRALIPFIAGSCGMKPRRFLFYNLLSAALWAPVYLIPGYWLGEQSGELDISWNIWIQLIGLALFALLIFHATHQQLEPGRWLSEHIRHFSGLHSIHIGNQVFLLLAVSAFIFFILCRVFGWLVLYEQQLFAELQTTGALKAYAAAITMLGDKFHLLGSTLILFVLFMTFRRYKCACLIAFLMAAVALSNILLKQLFNWPRPDLGAALYSSNSFPSGHTSGVAALLGIYAVLFTLGRPHQQTRLIYLALLIPILLVALSRVVLGVHWPLDVGAAIMEGLICAALLRWQSLKSPAEPPGNRLLLLLALLQVAFTLCYIWLNYSDTLSFYGL
ncbi:MAG: VTT domain-containing protein [Pontibacterium sp.]